MFFFFHSLLTHSAATKKIEALNMEILEVEKEVKKVDEHNHFLRMKTEEVMQEVDSLRNQVEAGQREYRQLQKKQEVGSEEEAEFMGNRYTLVFL